MDFETEFHGPDSWRISRAFGLPAPDDGYIFHFTSGSFVA